MKTTFTTEGSNYVMTFDGRLDTAATAQVKIDIQQLDNCEGHDIILDCTGLTYISSSGLRLFLAVLKNPAVRAAAPSSQDSTTRCTTCS